MYINHNFIGPKDGKKFTVEVSTDAIVVNLVVSNKTDSVAVELSRANLCTLAHMLELTLIETPLDVKENTDASTGS